VPYEEIAANWYSFPAVQGDLVYFGTADVYGMSLGYYAFNRRTGALVWDQHRERYWDDGEAAWDYAMRNIELLDFMAPTIWKNLVIFTGGDPAARAFDAKTGLLRWERTFDTPVASAPTIAGGRVYFGLMGDEENPPSLVCVSARDGKFLWSMETEGSVLSAPVIAGKRIIFGTDKSIFYVLEQVF
jgi:outer membrane protein assembly factor BamB